MKVAVTSKAFSTNETLVGELREIFKDVKLNLTGKKLEEKELIEFLSDRDAVIVALEDIDKNVIDALPNLKCISKFGVGLDNIDIEYCKIKNIYFGWSAGVNKFSVAEQALGFMLMLIRNLYVSSNKLSNGIWDKNGGNSLYGKTIGIIGVGNVGKELAKLLKPFSCKVLVNDVIDQDSYYFQHGLIKATKNEILSQCDIVSIHTPLNKETECLVNKHSLGLMRKTSYIINTARGNIVNFVDLKEALQENLIAGAALDVYDVEPPVDLEFLRLENLICTPHIGGNSKEATLAMGRSAIMHLKNYVKPF